MEASKWLQIQALLDISEMESLFDEIGPIHLFQTGAVVAKGELSKEEFLNRYKSYINQLKDEKIPEAIGTLACTKSIESVSIIHFQNQQEIIKIIKPVIMIQANHIGYSPLEEKFRPMIIGKDSITWGLQFSYPQLFQEKGELFKVGENFPNTASFKKLQKWMRHMTIPTPFMVEEKKVNVPMRLGKECLSWINKHPQLQGSIHVATP